MTPRELAEMLSNFKVNSASDEDLIEVHAVLSVKLAEVGFVINGRKHYGTHFPPSKKDDK